MEEARKGKKVPVCVDQEKTVISKIMQRFRPIAPKPALGQSSEETKSCQFHRSKNIVTLQLLPEKDNSGEHAAKFGSDLCDMDPKTNLYGSIISTLGRKVVESWLMVECVSDTCTELGRYHKLELSRMDQGEERLMRMLEVDTSPWLVSDMSNRVYWVNRAYQRMIGDPDGEVHIRVWLVVEMDLMEEIACMVEFYGAVTCRVRVRYEPSTWRMKIFTPKLYNMRYIWNTQHNS